MKQKLIVGAAILIALGAAYGGRKAYVEVEVKGCEKTVLYDISQRFGDIPDDIKVKILAQLDTECRQIL